MPEHLEEAICRAVTDHLKAELGSRGLLLTPDREATATADAVQRGRRLLNSAVAVWYWDDDRAVEFDGVESATRLQGALAFGAATAALLSDRSTDAVDLLCAMFTLGVGLVDSLCDGDPDAGVRVLRVLQERDVAKAAEESRPPRWLRDAVVPALALDPTVAFTVDVIEAFFETLHAVYAGEEWTPLRRDVAAQLEAALEAERRSVGWSVAEASRQELVERTGRDRVWRCHRASEGKRVPKTRPVDSPGDGGPCGARRPDASAPPRATDGTQFTGGGSAAGSGDAPGSAPRRTIYGRMPISRDRGRRPESAICSVEAGAWGVPVMRSSA